MAQTASQRPSLTDTVAQKLLEKIALLQNQGDEKLPPERELASNLGVSRRVIRQALDLLEADGLVVRTPGRGTLIASALDDSADKLMDLKQYTNPVELMEARLVLEPAMAALAATHATSKDLEDMHYFIERGSQASDHRVWERWDGALHRAIGRCSNNGLLIRFSEMLHEARAQTSWGNLRQATLTAEHRQHNTVQHRAIVAAITDRDPKLASRAMREHLLNVKRTLDSHSSHFSVSDPHEES